MNKLAYICFSLLVVVLVSACIDMRYGAPENKNCLVIFRTELITEFHVMEGELEYITDTRRHNFEGYKSGPTSMYLDTSFSVFPIPKDVEGDYLEHCRSHFDIREPLYQK